MREGGDSRYSHSSPKLMTNDECHASFMGGRSHAWAFVFMCGRLLVGSLLCMGSLSCGVVVLWFSWDNSRSVGGAYRVEEQ